MATVNPATPRQTLRAVEKEALLHEDDGDILIPLKRVRDLYMKRATELDDKMPGTGASDPDDITKRASMLKNAAFYRKAAGAVTIAVWRKQDRHRSGALPGLGGAVSIDRSVGDDTQ